MNTFSLVFRPVLSVSGIFISVHDQQR